jgi:hypothetical protein
MKILSAWVDDPTLNGEIDPPLLCVETDAYPDRTGYVNRTDDGWTQAKFGPFVQYDHISPELDAGEYNVRFAGVFPPIVDICLVVHGRNYSGMFGLPLTRARQLVRKHCRAWRLYLSDKDAQDGLMLWIPQMVEPTCRFWMPDRRCCGKMEHIAMAQYKGIYFPLCEEHLTIHNNRNAEARRSSTSK